MTDIEFLRFLIQLNRELDLREQELRLRREFIRLLKEEKAA